MFLESKQKKTPYLLLDYKIDIELYFSAEEVLFFLIIFY